jgi:catalase
VAGFTTYPDGQGSEAGPKRRLRPESFADHYSQARQFFASQNEVERRHIIDAFVFELSKCDTEAIRARMVAGLRNVGDDLAGAVAEGLGMPELPAAISPARDPIGDLPASPALSILANGPDSFAGRKIGILVTNGIDAGKLAQVKSAVSRPETTAGCRPTRRLTAVPRFCTTRSSCSPPRAARRRWPPCQPPATS